MSNLFLGALAALSGAVALAAPASASVAPKTMWALTDSVVVQDPPYLINNKVLPGNVYRLVVVGPLAPLVQSAGLRYGLCDHRQVQLGTVELPFILTFKMPSSCRLHEDFWAEASDNVPGVNIYLSLGVLSGWAYGIPEQCVSEPSC